MTEMSMIERVGRAIAECEGEDYWERYDSQAIAAIAAMREPTAAMLDAAGHAFYDAAVGHETGDKVNTPFVRFHRAAIDAALSEKAS